MGAAANGRHEALDLLIVAGADLEATTGLSRPLPPLARSPCG